MKAVTAPLQGNGLPADRKKCMQATRATLFPSGFLEGSTEPILPDPGWCDEHAGSGRISFQPWHGSPPYPPGIPFEETSNVQSANVRLEPERH
jgi:hypothetical protein